MFRLSIGQDFSPGGCATADSLIELSAPPRPDRIGGGVPEEKQHMNTAELIASLEAQVKCEVEAFLRGQLMVDVASVDGMESLCRHIVERLACSVFEAWKVVLAQVATELAVDCPSCGGRRKCKRRLDDQMEIRILGLVMKVPKLYLECGSCGAPGVSITRLLTGLSSGDASMELKLLGAYCAAHQSYGKASKDLAVHHGQEVERTWLRRQTLEVERLALGFAEKERCAALKRISGEVRVEGVDRLMLQGDGGSVRTGRLVACEPGDPGYGRTTPKTGVTKRKRVEQKREIITLDVRQPGEMEATGLDVLVPVEAKEGERARRMLALAARQGLGDNTQVLGLGDLGSRLPQAFDDAFVGYDAFYSGDWHHVLDYVKNATSVLTGIDVERWQTEIRAAIWERDIERRNALLIEAREHRVEELPKELERCPADALESYLINNWERMHAAELKAMGLDFVSARAESQVRDRTKSRFAVPGAWKQENLEGKATLKAIVDDGRFDSFRRYCLELSRTLFERQLVARLERALSEGRLSQAQVDQILCQSPAEQPMQKAA